jgi:hypothetical protein
MPIKGKNVNCRKCMANKISTHTAETSFGQQANNFVDKGEK